VKLGISPFQRLLTGIFIILVSTCAQATVTDETTGFEISGFVGLEYRLFQHSPQFAGQRGDSASLVAQPEFYREWSGGDNSLLFVPYLRLDEYDNRRSHADIREFRWIHVGKDWELLAGISKVFWGVTESVHLVDIINQTDQVDQFDGEAKLGQPMIKYTLVRDWGDLSLFVLPGFRERLYPGRRGRLRTAFPVSDHADYASPAGNAHVDLAVRYTHSFGDWDIGLSHFSGTSREPRFLRTTVTGTGQTELVPHYDTIDQTGLDLQVTKEATLWKLELITRSGFGRRYTAGAAGFEHTLFGVFQSRADLGLLMEYLYDDRGNNATTFFEDDVFVGTRLTLNDVASSELLAGVIFDANSSQRIFSVEGSRRVGKDMKLELESRLFSNIGPTEQLNALRRDSFVQLRLNYFF
jgi:hypothetical protein